MWFIMDKKSFYEKTIYDDCRSAISETNKPSAPPEAVKNPANGVTFFLEAWLVEHKKKEN